MATNYTINGKHFACKFSQAKNRTRRVIDIEETHDEFHSRTKLELISGDDGSAYLGRKAFDKMIDTLSPNVEVWFATDQHGDC